MKNANSEVIEMMKELSVHSKKRLDEAEEKIKQLQTKIEKQEEENRNLTAQKAKCAASPLPARPASPLRTPPHTRYRTVAGSRRSQP